MRQDRVAADYIEPGYVAVWLYLGALTAIELVVAYSPLAKAVMIGLLVGLALAKVMMVAMYFMHLRFERFALGAIAICPVVLIVAMIAGVLPDAATRAYPRGKMSEVQWVSQALGHNLTGGNPTVPPAKAK